MCFEWERRADTRRHDEETVGREIRRLFDRYRTIARESRDLGQPGTPVPVTVTLERERRDEAALVGD